MKESIAEIMVASLDNLIQAGGISVALADETDNNEIRRAVANLCGLMIRELDYRILPLVFQSFPHIEDMRKKNEPP